MKIRIESVSQPKPHTAQATPARTAPARKKSNRPAKASAIVIGT